MADENNEEKIRRKKDKKLSKHFDILVDNTKIKILNYHIKDHVTPFENDKVIILISKLKFDKIQQTKNDVIIRINTEKENILIKGEWKYAWHSAGNYGVAYLIKDFSQER